MGLGYVLIVKTIYKPKKYVDIFTSDDIEVLKLQALKYFKHTGACYDNSEFDLQEETEKLKERLIIGGSYHCQDYARKPTWELHMKLCKRSVKDVGVDNAILCYEYKV